MTKRAKRLKNWLRNPPKEVPVHEVEALLERFFPGRFHQRGSHIVVHDERLKSVAGTGPGGVLTIPVKGGQKVKGFYIRRLVAILKQIVPEEFEE